MAIENINNLTIERRDEVCELITKSFIIDNEHKEVVKKVIKEQQNISLKEDTVEKMLKMSVNILDNVKVLKSSIHNFNGYANELICVYEYNILKNNDKNNIGKNNILTILNPDTSSKTDIIHIIETDSGGVFAKAGGDVKSGQPSYVLQSYEKHLRSKYKIPFIDYSGYLTDNQHLLTPKQKEKLNTLKKKYPRKSPVQPIFSNQERKRLEADIINYLSSQKLPSELKPDESYIPKNREEVTELMWKIIEKPLSQEVITWSEFKSYSINKAGDKNKRSIDNPAIPNKEDLGKKEKCEKNIDYPIKKRKIRFKSYQLPYKSNKFLTLMKNYGPKVLSFGVQNILWPAVLNNLQKNLKNNHDTFFDKKTRINDIQIPKEFTEKKSPRPHDVSGHHRTLKDGRKITVRSYTKGNNKN